MVKLLLMLCVLIVLISAWIIGIKMYKTQNMLKKWRKYQAPEKRASLTETELVREQDSVAEVDAYEQQLFDDIAEIFMSEAVTHDIADAEQVQAQVFRKMPVSSKTQIRKMDLEEWSIYWTFYDQSLEYYVGKYGIFYAHVDRFGIEHKHEIRIQSSFG